MAVEAGDRPPSAARLARVALLVAVVLAVPLVIITIAARRHLDVADDAYDVYLQAMAALGEKVADVPADVRARLLYDMLAAGMVLLTTGWLAWLLRFRLRWVQVGVWLVAVAAWAGLGCGLAAAPEMLTSGSRGNPAYYLLKDLLVSWYPVTHSLLVAGVLLALTTASVLLLRTEAQEFYRKVNRADAVDWAGFAHDRTGMSGPDR
ncbi:hypothetical protein FHR83_005886 [Actinoplanes campanulatus]|uniref:Uncharacterized protein n=1 Tax=Actinoplanes campanulatus TaxID=113559 RepID=A0A7W5AKZ1_9ACTN|nr:hypothetical protein [Actinoplanes campanulatus]MBB3098191.1 hypothetical protein [Actinoplanes campanulatus]GGN35023.1 hypothetical protein GCM10010109_58650 [Actinoplanes campanulatus]GID38850.1 hypothetical protein Aca09nite_53560 [Actinoplanes campanulatus]